MSQGEPKEKFRGEIVIYRDQGGPEISIKFQNGDLWATQKEIAQLFGVQRAAITKHLSNIFKSAELSEKTVCSILERTAADLKTYQTKYYSLDAVIAVGYRVNSKKATLFRIWATQKLKELLLTGYALQEQALKEQHNQKLAELQQAVRLFQNVIEARRETGYEKDLLKLITDYASTWAILNAFDRGTLEVGEVSHRVARSLELEEVRKIIGKFKARLAGKGQAGNLFGKESGERLAALLAGVSQTYGGKELYPSLEEKAAHLLYFTIKDHPFADGNKRIGSLLFLLFLIENHSLYNRKGERKLNDNALAALALLVAESRPEQKNAMVKLVANLISKK
ncbi:MAG: virulence RhuM family protein [Patescibacteria group bacterium]|nr:virulence RhuM family protein [Patescibacteria group bacterium]